MAAVQTTVQTYPVYTNRLPEKNAKGSWTKEALMCEKEFGEGFLLLL